MSPPGIARGVPRTRLGLVLLTGAFLTAWVPNLITAGLSLILLATGGVLVLRGRAPPPPRAAPLRPAASRTRRARRRRLRRGDPPGPARLPRPRRGHGRIVRQRGHEHAARRGAGPPLGGWPGG